MDEPQSPTAVFNYKLVSDYTTRHADGSLARQAPLGGVILTFYVERFGYPTLMEQKFKEDGSLGEIVRFETEGHILREIQSGVVLSRVAAAALRDRLNALLDEQTA